MTDPQHHGVGEQPECPVHGRRSQAQSRDFCDVHDDFGKCGRYLLLEPELSEVRAKLKGEVRD